MKQPHTTYHSTPNSFGLSDGNTAPERDQFYFIKDHLGSSGYLTDINGKAIQHIEYLPFGELLLDQKRADWGTVYKYNDERAISAFRRNEDPGDVQVSEPERVGGELDCESGYYYYGARYYNPSIGRFLSVDPLAEKMTAWNPYNYTFNNPVNMIDPDGRAPLPVRDFSNLNLLLGDPKKKASEWSTSAKGISFIKSFEGLKLKLYNDDAGYATIGYGHLVHYGKVGTNTDKEKPFKDGITEAKALELLKNDVSTKAEKFVKKYVTAEITQEEFDALVSFVFNVGGGNFKKSSLLKKVNEGTATDEEITKKFKLWNKAGGKELKGLTIRREREAKIYTEGNYENN